MLTLKISTEEKGRDDPRDLVIVGYLFNGNERCCQIVKKRKGPYAGKYFQCDNPLAREPNPHSIRFCSSHKVETDRSKCKNYDDCKSYAAVAEKTGNVIEELFYSIEKETCVGYDHCVECILTYVNPRSVENWDATGKRTREMTEYRVLSEAELLQYEKEVKSLENADKIRQENPQESFISMKVYNIEKKRTVVKYISGTGEVRDEEENFDDVSNANDVSNTNANDVSNTNANDADDSGNDASDTEEDSEDSAERDIKQEREYRRKKNEEDNERKWQRAKQYPDNVRCKWVMTNGPRMGFRCHRKRAGAIKTGGDEYCNKCLKKLTVKVELYKDHNKISPTLTKIKQEIKDTKFSSVGTIYTRQEFNIEDYSLVYQKKFAPKLIHKSSSDEIKAISYHWKFIIEVLSSYKELAVEMAALLIMACDNRIKRCKEKNFWFRKNKLSSWSKSDIKEVLCKLKEFKDEFIIKTLDFITSIQIKKGNEIEKLCMEVKPAFQRQIRKDVLELFLQNIIDKDFSPTENPIGQRFIDDVLEFTDDKKSFHGITTSVLYDAREKWIAENRKHEIIPYSLIQFGRILTKHKLWETENGRSNIKKHLGIKLKNFHHK